MRPPPRSRSLCRRLASNSVSAPRPGRNLTERYRRLENTARVSSGRVTQGVVNAAGLRTSRLVGAGASTDTIAGFVIPREPRPPADGECCMSGCAVCVYDVYEEALAAYKDSVMALRAALSARRIPETEWPVHIRTASTTPTTVEKSKGAVLDAFEEMERALNQKRDKRAAVEAEKRARGDVLGRDGERVRLDWREVYEGIRWAVFPNR